MAMPSAVWNNATQSYMPPDPRDYPGEAPPTSRERLASMAAPPPPPGRVNSVYREQLKALGGLECPHCKEVFIPQDRTTAAIPATASPAVPESAGTVTVPPQEPQLVETDEPVPEWVNTDPEHGVEGTEMPGSSTEEEFQRNAPERTPAEKLRILTEWENAEDEDRQVDVLAKYGINRQHIGSWRGMHSRGKLVPAQDKL